MPADFDRCKKAGGRIRTVSGPSKKYGLGEDEYRHICISPDGGTALGYVKENQLARAMRGGGRKNGG